jgi:hypothetical protein
MSIYRLKSSNGNGNTWYSRAYTAGDSAMNEINRKTLEYLATAFQTPEKRYYFVGKLVRQDLVGPEPGFRDTLCCPDCGAALIVMGPSIINLFSALCPNDIICNNGKIWRSHTAYELWESIHVDVS